MNEALYNLVVEHLFADPELDKEAGELILAACSGHESLSARLEGASEPAPATKGAMKSKRTRAGAYLKSIKVAGFRGIGPESILELKPGPGITLILGRNGSGKSSFAEGLEFLLTGENRRWATRSSIWKEGWRNLHQGKRGRVEAEFAVESVPGGAKVSRKWGEAEDLKTVGEAVVQPHGKPKASLSALGWSESVENYRPFLSYSELGSLLDVPSKMYDAISSVLGLQELVETRTLLNEERKTRDKSVKGLKSTLGPILEKLAELEDARAEACHKALAKKRTWDLEAVKTHLSSSGADGEENLEKLRELTLLRAPEASAVDEAIRELRDLAQERRELTGSQADRCAQVAGLLKAALRFHEVHGDGDCPVCKKPAGLDPQWSEQARSELEVMEQQAEATRQLERTLRETKQKARQLIRRWPGLSASCGVKVDALETAWSTWAAGTKLDTPVELADHLEGEYLVFAEALETVTTAAKEELKRREDRWRPVAAELQVWVEDAANVEELKTQIKSLKLADSWMKSTEDKIRGERFTPISESARQNWEMLRQDSNVELASVSLAGTGPRRCVSLEVTVDGTEGAALGVMSQGELNSLALSLFLPRATLDESPFRFVIIDDPVQAMDPAKVDGLARVLEKAAKDRQVVVFTHDDRLFQAVRRLGIAVTAIEVTRRAGSVVRPRETLAPAQRALNDAWAVAKTPEVGRVVAGKVVPGFCRAAVEAALTELIRGQKLGKGCTHEEVEEALEGATTLRKLVALFFWDDIGRGGDVKQRLAQVGRTHIKTFNDLNEGTHGQFEGNAEQLVRDTKFMIQDLARK